MNIINEKNKPENFKYKIKGSNTSYTSLRELADNELKGIINKNNNENIEKIIEWTWEYETLNGDLTDTKNGENKLNNLYTFDMVLVGKEI